MKAVLVRHEKFIIRRRYVVEILVHEVRGSARYPDRLKWGLICADLVGGRRILMDNHHPKGPHIHLNGDELPYEFLGLDQLVNDFRRLAAEYMGVQI